MHPTQAAQVQADMEAELICARSALHEALEAVEDMKGIMADTACILDQKNAEVRPPPHCSGFGGAPKPASDFDSYSKGYILRFAPTTQPSDRE